MKTISHVFCGLLLIGLMLVPGMGSSAELSVPEIITEGFDALKTEGASAAIDAWMKGSALQGDKTVQAQASLLSQIETFYGKFVSATPLKIYRISPTSTLAFMEIHFEKGPAYGKFLVFRADKTELIVQFFFHTQPEQILPSSLLYPDS